MGYHVLIILWIALWSWDYRMFSVRSHLIGRGSRLRRLVVNWGFSLWQIKISSTTIMGSRLNWLISQTQNTHIRRSWTHGKTCHTPRPPIANNLTRLKELSFSNKSSQKTFSCGKTGRTSMKVIWPSKTDLSLTQQIIYCDILVIKWSSDLFFKY